MLNYMITVKMELTGKMRLAKTVKNNLQLI